MLKYIGFLLLTLSLLKNYITYEKFLQRKNILNIFSQNEFKQGHKQINLYYKSFERNQFMKRIEQTDLLNYTMLSNIKFSPKGDFASFIVATMDETSNSYLQDIWLWEKEKKELKAITTNSKIKECIWDDEYTLLYLKQDENSDKDPSIGESTRFFRRFLDSDKEQLAFTVPLRVISIFKIAAEKQYLITAFCDANYPDYFKMPVGEREKIDKERKENSDYQVMDELPFWSNGLGFINKLRKRLFIYDEKKNILIPISDPFFDVVSSAVSKDYIVFAGESYDRKALRRAEFYCYTFKTGKCRKIQGGGVYFVLDIENVDEKFLFTASTQGRYGIEENCCFYTIEPESGEITLLADPDISLGNSLGCDCRYGKTRSMKGSDGYLYFITTQSKTAELYCMDMKGKISPVITKEGSVDDFDILNGEILLTGLYDIEPQELYTALLTDKTLHQISSFNKEALKDKYVATPIHLTFNKHGIDMDGWVLLPYDFNPDKIYPAVLSIHGGPGTIFGPTFHHEMQMLAGAGYFVFFCNPEGSSGRGNQFADLRGKYGSIDYEDFLAFTDQVLALYPQIDKNRIGVIGGSYGGFMVNWIIGHTDRFAVAVSQRSISNWVSFSGYSDIGPWFGMDQMAASIYGGIEKMWYHSPLKYAGQVKTPTLFIHSDEDYRCGLPEGIQMFTALIQEGVPSRFCYFKGENHELSRSGKPKHRMRRLHEISSWLGHYLK